MYKRQECEYESAFQAALVIILVEGIVFLILTLLKAVSYTHLDVYKRQRWNRLLAVCKGEQHRGRCTE